VSHGDSESGDHGLCWACHREPYPCSKIPFFQFSLQRRKPRVSNAPWLGTERDNQSIKRLRCRDTPPIRDGITLPVTPPLCLAILER